MNASHLVCIAVALVVSACSTPRAALDAANNTAGLVGEMDKELREFRRVQATLDRHRKDLVREQAQAIALSQGVMAENDLFGAETASASAQAAARSLHALTVGLAEIDSTTQADLAALDKRLSELTSPLPATTDKAIAVQKALTLMGTELSRDVRLAELQTFFQTVREGVEKNRQKIKDAEQKAAVELKP
jgi:hypothetical protein